MWKMKEIFVAFSEYLNITTVLCTLFSKFWYANKYICFACFKGKVPF